jgi:hypothetical protein
MLAMLSSVRMAKSTKNARHIVVNDVAYLWRATGNDGWIPLVVWPDSLPGPPIACTFGYDQTGVPMANGSTILTKQIVITNKIVLCVVEYAIREFGYDARTQGKQLALRGVDKAIDMSNVLRSA